MTTLKTFAATAALFLAAACSGSMGSPGAAGPAGPQGPAAGVRFRRVFVTADAKQANAVRFAAALCPEGSKVIGGSCSCAPSEVHVSASTTISAGQVGALGEEHVCECDPPSTVDEWTIIAQATCVDGTGATVE